MSRPTQTRLPIVWFLDTSFLVTASVDETLFNEVRRFLEPKQIAHLKIIHDELSGLSVTGRPGMPGKVVDRYAWLPNPIEINDVRIQQAASSIQAEVANGQPLERPGQHLGEATVIAVGETATLSRPVFLTEDYNARVAAVAHGVEALSIHKLLHRMIRSRRITSETARTYTDAIHAAGRGQDYTETELISGELGRVGQP